MKRSAGEGERLSIMESLLAAPPAVPGGAQESGERVAQLTECRMRKARLVIRAKTSWLEEEG